MRYHLQVFRATVRLTIQDYIAQPLWPFWLTITPFAFALVGVFLYQDAPPETFALYVILGSGAMGMWSSALSGCGFSIMQERRWGTLTYTFTTPASQLWIAAGKSLVHAVVGLLTLLEIGVIATLFLNIPLVVASPWALLLAVMLTILSFAVIGLLLNSFFMLTRSASNWQNALSRFLYVFCGAMYPISMLPGWLRPVSYILAPTWTLKATRLSVKPEALSDASYLTDIGLALLLMIVYLLLSWYLQYVAERKLRVSAELERF